MVFDYRNGLADMLNNAQVIAVVGHSDKSYRTSYRIAQYLRQQGYKVYAVNPTIDEIDGEKSYASLADVPEPIDIVNVFRRSEHLYGVVEDAIGVGAGGVWSQLGVIDPQAEKLAQEANIPMVVNRCIMVEHARLNK